MAFETLTGGLELVIPTNGTTNWGTIVKNSTWQKINDHQHTGGGDGNQLPGGALADNTVTGDQLSKNLALTEASGVSVVANAATINWNNGNKASLDMAAATGTVALTLSNPLQGATYRLKITQAATPQVLTWPGAVQFPGGEEPSQHMEASTTAVVLLEYDGTNYLANWELEYA
jgi:hypothetical protein